MHTTMGPMMPGKPRKYDPAATAKLRGMVAAIRQATGQSADELADELGLNRCSLWTPTPGVMSRVRAMYSALGDPPVGIALPKPGRPRKIAVPAKSKPVPTWFDASRFAEGCQPRAGR
jgi:hypothetical protein